MIKSLLACFALLVLCHGLRAQTYVPVPYNFGGVFEVPDDSAGVGDTATDLTIDCLAANGYGQWTSSYKTQNAFDSGKAGIFLLANALREPSVGVATGIVSARPVDSAYGTGYPVDAPLTNRSTAKCVTNLKGRVRYVWPSADHTQFIVEGFDECPGDSSLAGINLEFVSYPYNSTYGPGKQTLGADVIKAAKPVGISIPLIESVVDSAHEPDPRDWFDLAMDTTNLYIVWEAFNDTTGTYNVYEITIFLEGGAIGYQTQIVAGGRRPTVSADLRRISTVADFDVSYLTGLLSGDHLTWFSSEAGVTDTVPLTKSCQHASGSGNWMFDTVFHARMLDATWANIASSDSTPRAIYAIVSDGVNHHLIMYKIHKHTPDAHAYYCDGTQLTVHATGVNDGPFPVTDHPIRAFTNPYDGEADSNFDEYHCMYQLARTYAGGSHSPLMLIHGAMVSGALGPKACLNYAGTNSAPGTIISRPDSLHKFYNDPAPNNDGGYTDNYNGAVNQMGIHLHWRNDKQHYYLRDRRFFDENIEENTLATEDVYIGDGTTHGGNYTPTIQPGKTMTLWTDRGVRSVSDMGECTVNFPDTGVNHASAALVAGTGSDTGANIVCVIEAEVISDTNTQFIDINPLSSLDVHGTLDLSDGGPLGLKLEGTGSIMTGGTHSYPDSIARPAYLNLHGSSALIGSDLIADSSILRCEYDQVWSDLGSDTAGTYLTLSGKNTITSCILQDDFPSNTVVFVQTQSIDPAIDTTSITNSLIQHGIVEAGGAGTAPFISITGGEFDNANISAAIGPQGATIENVQFKTSATGAIQIENNNGSSTPYQTYNQITISGCYFLEVATGADAIYASGYATDSNIMQNLQIINDTFNNEYPTTPKAAIELENSEGLIADNVLEGNFQYGIYVSGENSINSHLTKSTICSNLIRAGTIAGIYTDHTQGYAELNNVKVTGAAHISGQSDIGRIIYSNYSANSGGGIVVSSASAIPDLTGIHSTTPDSIDVAAFDTIESNGGVAQISLVKSASIRLGNSGEPWFWTNWCQNNIVSMSSDNYCACLGGGGGVSYVPLIIVDSGHSISPLGNISHNFFGDSVDHLLPENQDTGTGCNDSMNRGTPSSWIVGDSTPIAAMGFCYSADSNFTSWQNRPDDPVDCGETLPTNDKTKSKGGKTLSILTDTSCREKFAIGDADLYASDYSQCDSVLMEYIETCYDTIQSWRAFVDLSGGIANPSPTSFANYRGWLKSVLWLNTIDPLYYCTCAESIAETYEPVDGGRNMNAALAVIRYLDSSNRCPQDLTDNTNEYKQDSATRHQVWLDTVNSLHNGDTTNFPEDTTLPTIDELGLSILRGPPAIVQSDTTTTGISNLTASENPFQKSTTISFTTGEYSYISFQVFDVLGKVVIGDYKGTVLTPGTYSFNIDGTNLADGTYYARITTPLGETRMIKLVKE